MVKDLVNIDLFMSPSSRRAWIEILMLADSSDRSPVALLAEGVDRNEEKVNEYRENKRRPPRGGRG